MRGGRGPARRKKAHALNRSPRRTLRASRPASLYPLSALGSRLRGHSRSGLASFGEWGRAGEAAQASTPLVRLEGRRHVPTPPARRIVSLHRSGRPRTGPNTARRPLDDHIRDSPIAARASSCVTITEKTAAGSSTFRRHCGARRAIGPGREEKEIRKTEKTRPDCCRIGGVGAGRSCLRLRVVGRGGRS